MSCDCKVPGIAIVEARQAAAAEPDLADLDRLLEGLEGGGLIPILQKVQERYGYLPRPALEAVGAKFHTPLAKVYGVATFYAQFRLKPRGRHVVKVCLGTACHVRGGKEVLKAVQNELGVEPGDTTQDLRFTLEPVACLGACGLSPITVVDDDTYGRVSPRKVREILARYK